MARKHETSPLTDEALDAITREIASPPSGETAPVFEQSVQQSYLDAYGREIPNPTPLAPPIGYKRSPSIAEQMRAMIRQVSEEAKMAGAETEDEANDFDVGDPFDYDPETPYEHDFEVDPTMEALIALQSRRPKTDAAVPSATSSSASGNTAPPPEAAPSPPQQPAAK